MTVLIRALLSAVAISSVACASISGPTTRSGSGSTAPIEPVVVNEDRAGVVPAGTEVDVRLHTTLSSETATVEQRFETTTVVDVKQGARVLIPAGSIVRGIVSNVEKAGRLERTGKLTLSFDQIVVRGREHPMRATATQVFKSGGIREEGGTAGIGAGAGAVIGGILGGLQGAVLGAVIGAGGAIAATDGKDVELPAGAIIRIRLVTPVTRLIAG